MVTKRPRKRTPFEGCLPAILGLAYFGALLSSCSAGIEGDDGAIGLFFSLLVGGVLVMGATSLFSRPRIREQAERLAYSPCAVCGRPNRDGHGCHLEAIGRAAGSRRNYNGSYGRTWTGVVRDHYGSLPAFENHQHRCSEGAPCGHSDRYMDECGHKHRYQQEAQLCAWRILRDVQKGRIRQGLAIGPRPGAETVVKRVPLTDIDWPAMLRQADYRCYYCHEKLAPSALQKEHKIPLARGGVNHLTNIVPACGPCNRQKGIMTDAEYQEFRAKVQQRTTDGNRPNSGRKRFRPSRTSGKMGKQRERYPGPCPCGGTFRLRSGPHGRFYGCSRFPTCKETRPLAKNLRKR